MENDIDDQPEIFYGADFKRCQIAHKGVVEILLEKRAHKNPRAL